LLQPCGQVSGDDRLGPLLQRQAGSPTA
jgi:hypothetical protein